MANIHFIGGEKGGVGKSMTSRLLAQYHIDHNLPFTGFDSDQSHGTFSRFYADFAAPVKVTEEDSLDSIITCLEETPDAHIIIDLAAQTASWLSAWVTELDVFSLLHDMGHQVYFWHVMDDGADSSQLLARSLAKYPQPELKFVVVMNFGRGKDFSLFKTTDAYQQAQQRQAVLFELSRLQARLTQKIDFADLSFWAAANNKELMSTTERQRVKVWLNNNYQQFDTILSAPAD